LPSTFSAAQKLDLAEYHLQKNPGNILLLKAYRSFAYANGSKQRAFSFLDSQTEQRLLPLEWYRQWQDFNVMLERSDTEERLRTKLEKFSSDSSQNNSALLYLAALDRRTVSDKIKYFNEVIQASPLILEARYEKCVALKKLGEFHQARESCLESYNLYLEIVKKSIKENIKRDDDSEDEDSEDRYLDDLTEIYLHSVLRDKLKWNDFLENTAEQIIELDFALHDYENAKKYLGKIEQKKHAYSLALNVFSGQADAARRQHYDLVNEEPEEEAWSATLLFYFLEDFVAQSGAAQKEKSRENFSGLMQAYAQLEIGNYPEVERLSESLPESYRGQFLLLSSIGEGIRSKHQPDNYWQKAEQEFRRIYPYDPSKIADLLSSPTAPELEKIINMDIEPHEKALLLIAVAQRFPELRKNSLEIASKLAYTPFPPGHLLRRVIQVMSTEP
jgi:hypothetical protein